jgi:hypothetical protein
MLTFIIPLRSSQVSKSWKKVSELLERTLKSICNQIVTEFEVVVVCHEKPEIEFSHPRIHYAEVDFSVPLEDIASKDRDQARKMWVGLNLAKNINPSHIMFVDSDDCVSNQLADFVLKNPEKNGWYLKQGYEYPDGSETIYFRKKNFHRKTGTSHIIKYKLLEKFLSFELSEITNRNFLFHQYILEIMIEMGHPLEYLPFPGSVYVTDNGENNLIHKKFFPPPPGMSLKEIARYYSGAVYKPFIARPLTREIRNEFGL